MCDIRYMLAIEYIFQIILCQSKRLIKMPMRSDFDSSHFIDTMTYLCCCCIFSTLVQGRQDKNNFFIWLPGTRVGTSKEGDVNSTFI